MQALENKLVEKSPRDICWEFFQLFIIMLPEVTYDKALFEQLQVSKEGEHVLVFPNHFFDHLLRLFGHGRRVFHPKYRVDIWQKGLISSEFYTHFVHSSVSSIGHIDRARLQEVLRQWNKSHGCDLPFNGETETYFRVTSKYLENIQKKYAPEDVQSMRRLVGDYLQQYRDDYRRFETQGEISSSEKTLDEPLDNAVMVFEPPLPVRPSFLKKILRFKI